MTRILLFVVFSALLGILQSCSSSLELPEPSTLAVSPLVSVTSGLSIQPSIERKTISEMDSSATISLALVGDIMLGTDYPENVLADDDGISLLQAMTPYLQDADIAFGNLEGVLMDGGEPRKACRDPDNCYLFRSPSRYVSYLREAGFDVMSLANNHARDFGEDGRTMSMSVLASAGIRHSGRQGDVASWVVKGRRVALIAFAPFIGSHDFLDIELARQQVHELSQTHDIVLVSMHAGAEGLDALHVVNENEFYRGEDRGNSVEFAHAVIDSGADLVVGHGPHVPRALEYYKGRLIAYSLGNFCTFWGISVGETRGLAPVLRVNLDAHGQFLEGQIVSAMQVRPNGPVIDESHAAARLMAKLSQEDFPGSPLTISSYGLVQQERASSTSVASREIQ
ncbi:MAG: CapA family protein [Gammaproteobacteria bacterium]|nr:CapA family protein [Gammaproteobacteria bacterium]